MTDFSEPSMPSEWSIVKNNLFLSESIYKIQSLTLTSPVKLRLFLQREGGGTVLKTLIYWNSSNIFSAGRARIALAPISTIGL